jgi:hypothetical protein
MPTAATFAQLASRAGYGPDEPLVIATGRTGRRPAHLARGCLVRWCDALNGDRLGVTGLVQTPGRLDDGTPLDYAWGMGVRSHKGHLVYRHGGGYADVRTMLVRVPEIGLGLVVVAAADRSERRTALTDALLDVLLAGG